MSPLARGAQRCASSTGRHLIASDGATLEIHDLAPCQIDEPSPGRATPLELRRCRVFVEARRGVHGRWREPDAELAHVHPRAVALQQPTVETVGRDFIADPRRLLLR